MDVAHIFLTKAFMTSHLDFYNFPFFVPGICKTTDWESCDKIVSKI